MSLKESHLLRPTRREDWEDHLFALQVKVFAQIAKAAYIFEVTETGHFVLSPEEAVYVVSSDGYFRSVVAVSRQTGETFELYGLPDPTSGFQKLAKYSRLAVSTPSEAKNAALLFYELTQNPGLGRVVFSKRNLRRAVEDSYLARMPETKAERSASRWWRRFEKARVEVPFGMKTTRDSKSGFEVSVLTTTYVRDEGIELIALSIGVDRKGLCSITNHRTVLGRK
jgi:hypothetical protein